MKAWILHGVGDIRYEDMDTPSPREGEVLVRVMAAGVCGSDIPRVYQTGAHRMPLIPGHEFSGVVKAVGADVSPEWTGKRVGVYPLIPCGRCVACESGHPETCRAYDYVGSRRDGAFAEYVAVPAANLVELPDGVLFEDAAMLEPMAVAVHAMRKGIDGNGRKCSADARIVVCGLGTIGLLLVMFLRERGFRRISVIGSKERQRERAIALGIAPECFCDSRAEDVTTWLRERAQNPEVYFECVGKRECLEYGIDSSGPGTRAVLVGNPYTDMTLSRDVYWKILRNQMTICGTWNSSFPSVSQCGAVQDDWGYVLQKLKEGRIHPTDLITHRLPMKELERGLHIMRDKTEDFCKVMILPQE